MGFGKKEAAEILDWCMRVHFGLTLLMGLGVGTVIRQFLYDYTRIPAGWILPLWLLAAAAAMASISYLWNKFYPRANQGLTSALSTLANPSSTLTNTNNNEAFSIKNFLKKTYKSDMQAEMEDRVKQWKNDIPSNEREAVITQFMASGLIAYTHDQTWWTIFQSQLFALDNLNRAILRLEDVKAYYDKAAQKYPIPYATYSFQQWFKYLLERMLVIEQPGNTVGITVRGKDFLKHMVHYGYSATVKKL
jgi:membrane-bound lytic murein transglycosylase